MRYKRKTKMHPMVLTENKTYWITYGPLTTIKVVFKKVTKKAFNFYDEKNGEYILDNNLYHDKKCKIINESCIFWLPKLYKIKDENSITVSDFTFKNYYNNWLIEENV